MLKKAVQQGRSEPRARRTLRYVEPLSDTRTPLADFFSILLGGTLMSTIRPHEHEPARSSVTSLYGNRWLKGYSAENCESIQCVALSSSIQRLRRL